LHALAFTIHGLADGGWDQEKLDISQRIEPNDGEYPAKALTGRLPRPRERRIALAGKGGPESLQREPGQCRVARQQSNVCQPRSMVSDIVAARSPAG
jgi:hypothetical protein